MVQVLCEVLLGQCCQVAFEEGGLEFSMVRFSELHVVCCEPVAEMIIESFLGSTSFAGGVQQLEEFHVTPKDHLVPATVDNYVDLEFLLVYLCSCIADGADGNGLLVTLDML